MAATIIQKVCVLRFASHGTRLYSITPVVLAELLMFAFVMCCSPWLVSYLVVAQFVGGALCLDYRVLWVQIPPTHGSSLKRLSLVLLCCFPLLWPATSLLFT